MPRSKEFDRDAVLERAVELFWSRGYEATSIGDLTEHLGIGRQSLYDTFGDKRALYLKALACYRDQTNGAMQRMFETAPSVKAGFGKLLHGMAGETREQHDRGCLLLSANLQRDTRDAVVTNFLRDNEARVEAIFESALRRAQKRGELPAKENARALARFFVVTIQGMRALARLKSDRKALAQVADVALSVFG